MLHTQFTALYLKNAKFHCGFQEAVPKWLAWTGLLYVASFAVTTCSKMPFLGKKQNKTKIPIIPDPPSNNIIISTRSKGSQGCMTSKGA